jgi:hypothetical protein
MAQTVRQALSQAEFYSDDTHYVLVKLPARAVTAAAGVIAEIGEPFSALIVDKDEVTLLIPAEGLEEFAERLPHHQANSKAYRLITIDVELEPDLVGFIAHISSALADAGISILPYAAYFRDHLLVLSEQYEAAKAVLEKLKTGE